MQIKIELERKRRPENPPFEETASDQFQPINYMFKVMPEFQKESYSAKQMLHVSLQSCVVTLHLNYAFSTIVCQYADPGGG